MNLSQWWSVPPVASMSLTFPVSRDGSSQVSIRAGQGSSPPLPTGTMMNILCECGCKLSQSVQRQSEADYQLPSHVCLVAGVGGELSRSQSTSLRRSMIRKRRKLKLRIYRVAYTVPEPHSDTGASSHVPLFKGPWRLKTEDMAS